MAKKETTYNPDFVRKIKRASKQKSIEVDPNNLWKSLNILPYNPGFVKKILKSSKSDKRTRIESDKLWESI